MVFVFVFLVCFFASVVGAICGIGGGVIIKPALDAFHIMDVSTISFLSGCTVLSMSTYSVIRSKRSGASHIDRHIGLPLALGAAAGGMVGKHLFQIVRSLSGDPDRVGAIQAGCLLVITLGTLVYTLFKSRISTHQVQNTAVCVIIGFLLGIMSSFLGIGGGPINLVVLGYCFSMDTKVAAQNSLYIILFSQIASLATTLITCSVPEFHLLALALMVAGGITGGMVGRHFYRKMNNQAVNKLYLILMMIIVSISIFNCVKYLNL